MTERTETKKVCSVTEGDKRCPEPPTNFDVEGRGVNLCIKHAAEYQAGWRPENAPIEPDVERFILWKLRQTTRQT